MNLVIVESPTKAKTISKFLPKNFTVESSFGHIRDLPKSKMGVDIEHGFEPEYKIPSDKREIVKKLKALAKKSDYIYFATDEDREGEAIAWHLYHILEEESKGAEKKRITFHEITKDAILESLRDPRDIDLNRVDAQQARRVLDRLVGYELSPFLWKKVARGLSAGRVQSVAVRLIVEREREIQNFKQEEYWKIMAVLFKDDPKGAFTAYLKSKEGKAYKKLDIKDKKQVGEILNGLKDAKYEVASVQKKERTKRPFAPFTTSSLQIDAYSKFGYSAKQTMMIAQQLYEGIDIGKEGAEGLITYMRTDSLTLSGQFVNKARSYIKENCGGNYIPEKPIFYKTKSKSAQEAHEAIRPTDPYREPDSIGEFLDAKQLKIYRLIWQRTLASQMQPAIYDATNVDISAKGTKYMFKANGSILKFNGFQKIYPVKIEETILPDLKNGDALNLEELKSSQHFTEPPPRYSDGSLVKALEEKGIGRPSTYAPTISTIQTRNYVERNKDKRFEPTEIGTLVTDLLVNNFTHVIDYDFTAEMEESLDDIADGKKKWVPIIQNFYAPFKKNLTEKYGSIKKEDVMQTREVGVDPKTGLTIFARYGRFGPYVQLGERNGNGSANGDGKKEKPRSASLKDGGQTIDSITLEQALILLSLPRSAGQNDNAEDIIVNTGRFGPYIKCGKTTVSIPDTFDPYTITLEECKDIIKNFAKIKKAQAEPIAKLGKDPNSQAEILVKTGRYGPYITDGKTNVSIRKSTDPKEITLEKAIEMLEKKRKSPKKAWGKKK